MTDDGGGYTRRGALSSLVGAVVPAASVARGSPPMARIRVYVDTDLGWSAPAIDAVSALRSAVAAIHLDPDVLGVDVEIVVERADRVPESALASADQPTLWQSFRDALSTADASTPRACHLLLVDRPFDAQLGYGFAAGHVGRADRPVAVANVGAAEFWDGRSVARNVAVHEALHCLLTPGAATDVLGHPCEHNLGAVRAENGGAVVTPMATMYADETSVGGETYWHGTGCYDHDRFYRYEVDPDEVTGWSHTPIPSAATVAAVHSWLTGR